MKSSDVVRALAPADQAGEDEPLSALMYPLRFLGMGLLIAWLCCTHVASIFPGDVFDPALRSAFDTGMRIGDIGTFLAFVLFAPRIGRLSRHKAFSWAAVALTTAGTAAVGLALIPGGVGEAVIIPASIVTAIGGAVLFCLWAEAYSQMGATRTVSYTHLDVSKRQRHDSRDLPGGNRCCKKRQRDLPAHSLFAWESDTKLSGVEPYR